MIKLESYVESNLTVAFSGYNMKHFAILAIESFLFLNPHMRSSVVYFDDFSTDGTKEELEKRGIRVITWLSDVYERFEATKRQNLYIRVSYINESILKQVETRYLFLFDGDVAFFGNEFYKNSLYRIQSEKAIALGYRSCIPLMQEEIEEAVGTELFKYLNEYNESSYFKKNYRKRNRLIDGHIKEFEVGTHYSERMLPTFMLIDAELCKKSKAYTDIPEDINLAPDYKAGSAILDTSVSWFYVIKSLGYPILDTALDDIQRSVIHLDWVASSIKFAVREHHERIIKSMWSNPNLGTACRFAGIRIEDLIFDLIESKEPAE